MLDTNAWLWIVGASSNLAAGRALLRWNERANDARVTIRALIDNRAVVASRPAA